MSISHVFEGLQSILQSLTSTTDSTSEKVPADSLTFNIEAEPLCASNFLGETPQALLEGLTQDQTGWQKGLSLFRSEAIPLATNVTVSKTTIPFFDTKVGSSSSDSFMVNNNSDCPVRFTVSSPSSPFSASTTGQTLQPHSSTTVTVTFSPTSEGDFSAYINVNPGTLSIYLRGKGVKKN